MLFLRLVWSQYWQRFGPNTRRIGRLQAQRHDRRPSARHADAAAHHLKGHALHTLRGAEGMLLAGAAQSTIQGLAVGTPTQA